MGDGHRCFLKSVDPMVFWLYGLVMHIVVLWFFIGFPIWILMLAYNYNAALTAALAVLASPMTFAGTLNGTIPIDGTIVH